MVCDSCGTELPEGKYICPKCERSVLVLAQSKRLEQVKKERAEKMKKVFKSPMFIVLCAFMSLLTLMVFVDGIVGLISSFTSFSILSILFSLWEATIFIFPLLAMIAGWKLLASQHVDVNNVRALGKYSNFYKVYMKVIRILLIILFALVGVLLIITMAGAASCVGELDSYGSQAGIIEEGSACDAFGSSIFIVLLVLGVLITGVFIYLHYFIEMHDNIARQYGATALAYASGNFNEIPKAPQVSLYIFAGLGLLSSLLTLGSSPLGSVVGVLNAAYLVLTGVFFVVIEKNLQATALVYVKEKAKYDELNKKANAELAEIKRIRREEERLALEAEKEKARMEAEAKAEQQRQQEELMKQMMQQMLLNNMQQMAQNNPMKDMGGTDTATEKKKPTAKKTASTKPSALKSRYDNNGAGEDSEE